MTSLSRVIFVLVFVLLLCGPLLPGQALASSGVNGCIDSCFSSYSCSLQSGGGNGCEGNRSRCLEQCNANASGGGSNGSSGGGAYGAIAYDKDSGAWGLADGSPDKGSAKKSALRFCGQHGDGCQIVETFSNTCAAVASGTDDRLGWATDGNGKQAALKAVETCNTSKDGWFTKHSDGSRCSVTLRHCYH